MRSIYSIASVLCLTFIVDVGFPQTPSMMTREQAGAIALRFAQSGRYPGTLHWLTTQDLPTQQEVMEGDTSLVTELVRQGKDWSFTMRKKGHAGWFGNAGVYKDTYIFRVTFDQFPDRVTEITVNGWTGYCEIGPLRKISNTAPLGKETNTELGLGNLPVKTVDELRDIALSIAQQLLGAGSYDVLTYAYTSDKQQMLAEYGWVFVIFKINPQTGAHLPQMVALALNSRTGWLEEGQLWNRPLTVSTNPAISKDEAKKKAAEHLAQFGITVTEWLEDGLYAGKILDKDAFPYNAVAGLYIVEDDLLQQHLMWIFIFSYSDQSGQTRYEFIAVNAHTGAVRLGFSLNATLALQRQKLLWEKHRVLEIPWMIINGEAVGLEEPLLLVHGRVYIGVGYAANPLCFGTKWDGKKVKGKGGEINIKASERFIFQGRLYIPLRRLCEAAGIHLGWNNELKVPILKVVRLEPRRR